ncbi:intermembrane transport protein PqiB [Bowmanella pacifica]|uniref:Paraquat-inducible protein B n=1 Tax=Bowmanella pacifica TaxID=502051 RepID=A0A917YTT2_9ALTE|nr:intermembrane transport protein PqiB [Bowmanella pacifica]GGO66174.1 paraquat-inducible protein B [Bowmanella pacifica]
MPEQSSLPQAKIKPLRSLSWVWLIPFIAVLLGGWMLFSYSQSQGPTVTLHLTTAEGIEVGKTAIKARNVKLGVISDIALSEHYDAIVATAKMTPEAARMLSEDAQLWVVKPRIGTEGVSGLDTLLSGAYIELQPGKSAQTKSEFVVHDVPPISALAAGKRVSLTHAEAGKLKVGDPVLYEGFTVGRVEKVSFNTEVRKAEYGLFIFEPYDSLLKPESRFWLTSGIDMTLSSAGVDVNIGSLETLISGGVSFRVPDGVATSAHGASVNHYPLYDSLAQVQEQLFEKSLDYVMLFDESVRGLAPGAPVEYRGIKIGSVSKVPLGLLQSEGGFNQKQIPVLVKIDLGRIFDNETATSLDALAGMFESEFAAGLRGTLSTGNLLTGALFIDISFQDDEAYQQAQYTGYPVFPTTAGGVGEIQKQVSELVKKANALPLDTALNAFTRTMESAQGAADSFSQVAQQLNDTLASPAAQSLPAELQQTLMSLRDTLGGFSPDSALYQHSESTMAQMNQATKDLQSLLRKLNEQPNALIFGYSGQQDPLPKQGD